MLKYLPKYITLKIKWIFPVLKQMYFLATGKYIAGTSSFSRTTSKVNCHFGQYKNEEPPQMYMDY